MCAMRKDPNTLRLARFEAFEPRVLLSADAIGRPLADFTIDYCIDDYFSTSQELQAAWVAAHDLTGLTSVCNAYGLDGSGQTVVVIDTGVAYNHESLGGGLGEDYRVVGGYDFAEADADPYDDGPLGSHGTHVAGIIASDDQTHTGVAPGVDIVSLRVFNDQGQGTFEWVEEALQWVVEHVDSFENPITTVNLSLGVVYNSDTIPSWAILEDELATLAGQGIFISVAAGNKFTSYNQPGLSYPAVSDSVVPVASLDADGLLSFYSQRSQRVIAAPGRSITSTVPDYVGNDNSVDDDFATYSGTSMASPYVAGASVLIRQAFEFVGVENVTQDMIYELMCTTADSVYDSVTEASYYGLNIARAIEAIMPDDDYASTEASAYSLGTVTDTLSLDGLVGTISDVDWFSFTASQSGIVAISADVDYYLDTDWSVDDAIAGASISDGILSFEVTAGASYAFGLGTSAGIGHYTIDVALDAVGGGSGDGSGNEQDGDAAVDPGNAWGVIAQQTFAQQQVSDAGRWFSLTAANDGILTVEALFKNADGDIDIELYDADQRLLAGSYTLRDNERLDVAARAGEQFLLRAVNLDPGVNENVDFRVTNLVSLFDGTLAVAGTDGNDTLAFSAGQSGYRLTVNGVGYSFAAAQVAQVSLDGSGGQDTLAVAGGSGTTNATLAVGRATLQAESYSLSAANFEDVAIRAGDAGGMAVLYDSAGDDTLLATPQTSTLSGAGFSLRAEGFSSVLASAASGGSDTARFLDSAGDDTFLATPGYSRMRGDGYYLRAKGFEDVFVDASAGGYDRAYLFDSSGDDTLRVSTASAMLAGGGFSTQVDAFEYVRAIASGGYDTAIFQSPADGERFTSAASGAVLRGEAFYIRGDSFDHVHALAAATAAVDPDAYAVDVKPDREPLDHLLAQSSFVEFYGYQYARSQLRRSMHDDDDDRQTQALDHVLGQFEEWA